MTNPQEGAQLAILGGPPAFSEPLHVGRPNLGDFSAFQRRLQEMWDRRWLTNDGPLVREFEEKVRQLLGVEHVIAVCNGTVGLEIAIRGLDLEGEVIIPAFTFVATAHALRWQGLQPVFCDIERTTHNIDPGCIEDLITPNTSAIMGVHLWGGPCDVNALQEISLKHGLKLLYDASHAFGNECEGTSIGNFGEVEVFSFHATKFVNAFEGGVLTTNNAALATKFRLLRNFGFNGYDSVVELGTNGKMSEISAAMGLTSLESMNEFIARNQSNLSQYQSALGKIPGLHFVPSDTTTKINAQYVVCEVDAPQFGLTRDELLTALVAENIRARRYFYPGCHRSQPYVREDHTGPFPVTESIAETVLQFPTGTAVSLEEIERIQKVVLCCHRFAPEIRDRIRSLNIVNPNLGITTI